MPSNLRYGAFDEKKKQQGLKNAISAPPPQVAVAEPQVPIPSSVIDPRSPLGKKQGLVDESAVEMEQGPPSEMDMIKRRFGYSGGSDPNSSNNVAAVTNFLARGQNQDFGMHDYVPEEDTGGDYLAIMARDGQNEAIGAANRGIVSREQEGDATRQAQIQNALKQDAAYQKMEIEAQEAAQVEEFFRANGIIPSPQAMVEFQKQQARQRATSDYASTASGLAKEYSEKIKQLYRGYEDVEESDLPPSIVRGKQLIDKEYADKEHNMMLLTGMISDVNDPGKLIPKGTPGLQ